MCSQGINAPHVTRPALSGQPKGELWVCVRRSAPAQACGCTLRLGQEGSQGVGPLELNQVDAVAHAPDAQRVVAVAHSHGHFLERLGTQHRELLAGWLDCHAGSAPPGRWGQVVLRGDCVQGDAAMRRFDGPVAGGVCCRTHPPHAPRTGAPPSRSATAFPPVTLMPLPKVNVSGGSPAAAFSRVTPWKQMPSVTLALSDRPALLAAASTASPNAWATAGGKASRLVPLSTMAMETETLGPVGCTAVRQGRGWRSGRAVVAVLGGSPASTPQKDSGHTSQQLHFTLTPGC